MHASGEMGWKTRIPSYKINTGQESSLILIEILECPEIKISEINFGPALVLDR